MKKENISLALLKILEPYTDLNGKLFTIDKNTSDRFVLTVKDILNDSNFYFATSDLKNEGNGKLVAAISFTPGYEHSVAPISMNILQEHLSKYFEKWVKMIQDYYEVKSVFDDPFLSAFQEEFEEEFQLSTYSDTKPFTTKQILQLDFYLEKLSENVQKIRTDNNVEDIDIIEDDIQDVRNNLSIKTQMWILQKIFFIYAQLAKQGPAVIKEFMDEAKKSMIKEIISKGINLISNSI